MHQAELFSNAQIWCEDESFLNELFCFHHLEINFSDSSQNSKYIPRFVNTVSKYAQEMDDASFDSLKHSCGIISNAVGEEWSEGSEECNCKVLWFVDYGCSLLVNRNTFGGSESLILNLSLICLDCWEHSVHSTNVSREHTSKCTNYSFVPIGNVPLKQFESFKKNFYETFEEAKKTTDDSRSDFGRQKTPAFVINVLRYTLDK
jgi:hypothetical protein